MKGIRGTGKGWFVLPSKRDGQFIMKYRTDDGRWPQHRVPKEYQVRRDAERYAAVFHEEFSKAPRSPAEIKVRITTDDGPTLGEFIERWLGLRKQLVAAHTIRPATHKQDRSNWKTHIQPVLATVPLTKLDPPVLRDFIRKLDGTRANYTVRNITSTLKQMLDDIDAEGWFALPRNPMRHPKVVEALPPPRTKAGKKVIIHAPREVMEKLLKSPAVEAMMKLRYVLTLTAGLRMGELFGLRLVNLRLDDDVPHLRVREALALEGFDGRNTLQAPKTEDGERNLPLQSIVSSAFRWWLEVGWIRWVGREPKPEDFVFPNEFGKPYRPKAAEELRADLQRAGCPTQYEGNDLTAHALRRSFSTLLDDVPDAQLVKPDLMGHSAPGVDRNHYSHRSLERKRRAIEGITLDVTLADLTNGERQSGDAKLLVPEAAE